MSLLWTARISNQSILKENQSWIGRTDAKAPVLWPPDAKNWLTGKDPDARKDWRQEEKETMEDEMIGWHQQLDGHEFEQSLGDGEGQEGLVCCSPWGLKESDMTEQLNNNKEISLDSEKWTDVDRTVLCTLTFNSGLISGSLSLWKQDKRDLQITPLEIE